MDVYLYENPFKFKPLSFVVSHQSHFFLLSQRWPQLSIDSAIIEAGLFKNTNRRLEVSLWLCIYGGGVVGRIEARFLCGAMG